MADFSWSPIDPKHTSMNEVFCNRVRDTQTGKIHAVDYHTIAAACGRTIYTRAWKPPEREPTCIACRNALVRTVEEQMNRDETRERFVAMHWSVKREAAKPTWAQIK